MMLMNTILLVDDSEWDQIANKRAVSKLGTVILSAKTVEAGLAMNLAQAPDLIVLDYNLPDGNGLDFLRRMQEQLPEGCPPVVMLTGSGDEEIAVAAIKAGASDYLIKDVSGGHLKLLPSVVERAWRDHHIRRAKKEAEGLLQLAATVYQNISEGILATLPDGTIVSVNPALVAMTGYTAAELVGGNPRIFKSGRHGVDAYEALWTTLQHEGRWRGELWNRRKDGSHFLARETITAIHGESGEIRHYVAVLVDATEARKAEAELEQHRQHLQELVQQRTTELLQTETRASLILQSSANGLYGVDVRGVITFMNPVGCTMLGYRLDQVVGQRSHALFHHSKPDGSAYPPEECPTYATLRQGKDIRVDNEVYWHADGHAIPVMYATHPMVQDGVIQGAVISFVDISEQRAVAQAREAALLAAENLARARREFLANMSHEIRTPLNGVLGFAQIGLMRCKQDDPMRHAFEMIQESGNRLLGVVNDVLDFSQIEVGKLVVEHKRVLLADVIGEAMNKVRGAAQAKHLDLRVTLAPGVPLYCLGDPVRLGQILFHILSNAVKFTEAGAVTVLVTAPEGEVVFNVTDTGIGISEDQLWFMFNPFQQGDSSCTRRFGGSGLGLTIVKGLLDLMGGHIIATSQLGKGSSFEFRLPCKHGDDETAPYSLGADTGGSHTSLADVSVLVAEDSDVNRQVLEGLLTSVGARVTVVNNGREAVERVIHDGGDAFDVVLMDIQMPEMDGYEATRRLLALAPTLPIIGQTAHAFAEEAQKCQAVGMVDHLAKPIDRSALVRAIEKALKRK